MIPTASNYPDELDTNDNLFEVHDFLRARLVEDYNPGDTSIQVEGDLLILSRFPTNGLITLTEQCSDIDKRAISFHYDTITITTGFTTSNIATISGLELLPGFPDVIKPAKITNVTMNVMAQHHNNLKNALIAIEEFIGIKGTIDTTPFGPTLEGRINFLRRLVLQPKAWFTANKRIGIVPLEVEFTELAFRLGTDGSTGEIMILWDFGDGTTSITSNTSVINVTDRVPDGSVGNIYKDLDFNKVIKVYNTPGIYTVKMTASNDFGEDTCVFEQFINARIKAPDKAIIQYTEGIGQNVTPGVPPNGPFDTTPTIRSPINTLIEITVAEGENFATPGISYGGEFLDDSNVPIDPIVKWTWGIGDDLGHPSSRTTKAAFSIGGIYDLKLRADTEFGAYRITNYENSIDIIENTNLWLWTFDTSGTSVRSYEFGLISETFKLSPSASLSVSRNDSFLDGVANEADQKREFARNTAFAPRGTTFSGQGGLSMLFWSSGRNAVDPISSEVIYAREFDGFNGTYITRASTTRPWNWASWHNTSINAFVFGTDSTAPAPFTSPTNLDRQEYSLSSFTVATIPYTNDNFLNGASELGANPSTYDISGNSVNGNYSVYRTAVQNNVGYLARNDNVGGFFRIKSFYQTEGITTNPFRDIRKMQDIQGPTKLEGQLTDLSSGIYFFNNTGSMSKFDPLTSVWTTGGPGINSALYRNLQDTSVEGYDDPANTLLVSSDGDRRAYISFDYSNVAFVKFNEINLTFSSLVSRPDGEQWLIGVF